VASRRTAAVRLEALVVHGDETLLHAGATAPLLVAARPDRRLARLVTSDVRHIGWVRLRVDADGGTSAELFATARRPVRRRLPLGAALALAESGVPTLLVRECAT
jgi:hypothetical protein